MRKKLVEIIMAIVFTLGWATLAYAGSSTVIFDGSGGSILIVTSAPGVSLDNFEVTSEGNFRAQQQLITSSPTSIMREGEFSGGGTIRVITKATGPEAEFGVYLASDETGYVAELVTHGYSVEFLLEAQAEGKGDLQIVSTSPEMLNLSFGLIFDYSTMSVVANARPFDLAWITSFDESVGISGTAYID